MSVFKCKMCGGTLEVEENAKVCECEFCGTKQTLPSENDEQVQSLYNRANVLRMKGEFDKADYNMACALMTLVLREDYWKNGAFDRRYHAGEVTPIDDAKHLQEKAQTDESKAAAKKIYDAMRYSDLTSDEASVQEKNDNEADQRAWSADGL